jgi:hypothetical protein
MSAVFGKDLVFYQAQNSLIGQEVTNKDEIIDKRMKILRAYKNKAGLSKSRSEAELSRIQKETAILALSPIKVPKMKKFSYSVSPCIASSASKPPPIAKNQHWWANEPSVAGSLMNDGQKRLSSKENFTGSVKHSYKHFRRRAQSRGVVFDDDYVDPDVNLFPEVAYKFLETSSTWKSGHHMLVQRQGDLLSEATFRSSLRSDN